MKNYFYFIWKALFVLKIYKFLYFCLPLFFSLSVIAFTGWSKVNLKVHGVIHCLNKNLTIAIRNGKIVWKEVWVEYYLRLNFWVPEVAEFWKILVPRLAQNTSNENTECSGKLAKQRYSLCEKFLVALIYLHFFVFILICF